MKAGGKEVYSDEGLIGWDDEAKKVVFFCFGMDGSIGQGKEIESAEKDTHVIEGTVTGDPM